MLDRVFHSSEYYVVRKLDNERCFVSTKLIIAYVSKLFIFGILINSDK